MSGQAFLVAAGAGAAVFGVASYRANRRAIAIMRSSKFLAMAQQAAGLLLVDLGDLAPLLGLHRVDVDRWGVDGVPARHQRAVADLHRAAVALRRRFPAQLARQLLAVRLERRVTSIAARRHLVGLSRASRPGHISVTLR